MNEKDFPILHNKNKPDKNKKSGIHKLHYLDNAATTQKPQIVIDAHAYFYENHNANVHRGLYKLSEEATQMLEESRKTIAGFINANQDEIIFTKNATESFNNLANSLERTLVINKECNIVSTVIEHHSNFVPWQQLAKRTEAEFRVVDYDVKKNELHDVAKYVDKDTIIVAFTGMSNVNGLMPDVKKIISDIRKKNKNAIIIVDGTQLVAHKIVDVKDLDVDFMAFSAHKVYGPTGVGILYGKKELLEKIHPFHYGGNMVNKVELTDTNWAESPDKFEAGTIDTAGIVAAAQAITYLQKNNFEKLLKYEDSLKKYLLKELRKIKSIKIIGYDEKQLKGERALFGPVVSFTIDKVHPHDIAAICDEYNVCIRAGHHCAQPFMKKLQVMATARASLSFYNSKEDVDTLVEALKYAIKKLAANN